MSRACVIFGSGVAVEEVQPRGRAEGGGRAVVVVCGLRWENTCQPLSYRELIAHRGHFLPPGGGAEKLCGRKQITVCWEKHGARAKIGFVR